MPYPAGHRRREGRGRILDHAIRGVVQAAMGDRSRGEPIEVGHRALGDRVLFDISAGYFEQAFDFDRRVGRQRRDANCAARVTSLVAERFDHQIRCAVHDLRVRR